METPVAPGPGLGRGLTALLRRSKTVSQVCLYPGKDMKIQAVWFGLYFGRMVASFFNDPGAEFRNV